MMDIQLRRARRDEQSVIYNLSLFYVYEFAAMMAGIDFRIDGLYDGLPDLNEYWNDPTKHPFLVTVDDKPAGFVLVSAGRVDAPNYIDEFFIARKFMGKGVGRAIAHRVFDAFPGKWKVTQIRKNYSAQAFWRSVISAYTKDTFTEHYDDKRRSVQLFDNTVLLTVNQIEQKRD